MSCVAKHLEYLSRHAHCVRRTLNAEHMCLLAQVEARRRDFAAKKSFFRRAHLDAVARMCEIAGTVPELDFPAPPTPDAWIAQVLDRALLYETLRVARLQMAPLLPVAPVPSIH